MIKITFLVVVALAILPFFVFVVSKAQMKGWLSVIKEDANKSIEDLIRRSIKDGKKKD